MAIFTTPSVVIWYSTGTLGIFATLVHVFIMRVVIYDILSRAILYRVDQGYLSHGASCHNGLLKKKILLERSIGHILDVSVNANSSFPVRYTL